ncbi:MAG: DUF4129 domain-containing protein [Pseudomonadota bacterium]
MKRFCLVAGLLISTLAFSSEPSLVVTTTSSVLQSTALPPSSSDYIKSAKEKLHEVLQQPEFGEKRKETRVRWKGSFHFPDFNTSHENDAKNMMEWMKNVALWLSRFTEVLLWLVIAVSCFFVFYFRQRWLPYLGWVPKSSASKIEEGNALSKTKSLAQESLPLNITDEVLKRWNQGDTTTALSLLYRATLRDLRQVYHLKLAQGATEREIVEYVSLHHAPLYPYLSQLTAHWQCLVYAHQPHTTSIHTLVEDYQRLFVKIL